VQLVRPWEEWQKLGENNAFARLKTKRRVNQGNRMMNSCNTESWKHLTSSMIDTATAGTLGDCILLPAKPLIIECVVDQRSAASARPCQV